MIARRLLPLAFAVTALLALVAIASHGRPLAGGRGSGPTATFFDYVATTLVLLSLVLLALVVVAAFSSRPNRFRPRRSNWYVLNSLLMLAASALLAWVLLHSGFEQRLRDMAQQVAQSQKNGQLRGAVPPRHVRDPRLRWDEIAVVLALLGVTALVLLAQRGPTRSPASRFLSRRREAVSLALDESIDDLRTDPDLRRAIIAAYARMERALSRARLPRRPSEAPYEYLERALETLEASAGSAQRLTALFERAKFSQHMPDAAMRDDAIDALVAVRDELRRPPEQPVTA